MGECKKRGEVEKRYQRVVLIHTRRMMVIYLCCDQRDDDGQLGKKREETVTSHGVALLRRFAAITIHCTLRPV